jgi:hypothetical protein
VTGGQTCALPISGIEIATVPVGAARSAVESAFFCAKVLTLGEA